MTRIELFCAVLVRTAIIELASQFEKISSLEVGTKFDLNPVVKKRIDQGETFDLVIINPGLVDDLVAQKKVRPTPRVGFGRVEMGIAARASSKRHLTASTQDFKRTLLEASSIAYSVEGTSGKTFEDVLRRLDIFEAVHNRLMPVAGGQTTKLVASGEAELGVIPVSAILEAREIELAGLFPTELGVSIDLTGGISANVKHLSEAQTLLEFLTGPLAEPVLSARGVGPFTHKSCT